MLVSPISNTAHLVQPYSPADDIHGAAAADTATAIQANGDLDLFAAAKFYREKAEALAKLSQQSGSYQTETLSDSEIKSLRLAGVPIDAFLKQHGEKLGSREFGMLSELITKSQQVQGSFAAEQAAPTQAAPSARAYV